MLDTRRCVKCDRPTIATYTWERLAPDVRRRLHEDGIVKRGTAERCRSCAARYRKHGDADPGPRGARHTDCRKCAVPMVTWTAWRSMPIAERDEARADGFRVHRAWGLCEQCYSAARKAVAA